MPQNVHMMDAADGTRKADFGVLCKWVSDKATAYTIPDIHQQNSGGMYTNRGASGSVTFTLPTPDAVADKGHYLHFVVAIAQNIVLTATGGYKINNGSANGSVTLSSGAPGLTKLTFDGTGWYTSGVTSTTNAAWGSIGGTLADQTDLKAVTDALTATDALKALLVDYNTATVTLTNGQIKNLRATPKELVAAPASGKVLVFLGATLRLIAGANVLSETDDNLAVKYTNGSGVAVSDTVECTGFIDGATDKVIQAVPVKDALMTSAAALVLHNTGNGEFGDNAANDATMKVFIRYQTVTL